MELSAVPIYRGGTEGSATWQKDWNALGSHSTEHWRSLAEVDDALYAAKPTMLAIESVSGPARGPIFATAWTGKGNVRLAARRPVVQAAILLSTSATSADETQELSGISCANATERGGKDDGLLGFTG
jgi:hypothetical protein